MSLTYIAPVFQVADLARSLAFYRDQLGFDVAFVYEGSYADVCRDCLPYPSQLRSAHAA